MRGSFMKQVYFGILLVIFTGITITARAQEMGSLTDQEIIKKNMEEIAQTMVETMALAQKITTKLTDSMLAVQQVGVANNPDLQAFLQRLNFQEAIASFWQEIGSLSGRSLAYSRAMKSKEINDTVELNEILDKMKNLDAQVTTLVNKVFHYMNQSGARKLRI